ncbi:alpha/beta fold hydrolase [Actinomadura viridis]|uniref:Pimeloyl-ACP methyl ester carboxylesterase n=1 Tax=Actinomadura viridis TaxID=58110 RepID=A0A931DN01_9ACTN|nr:alpha/beta fold hydrolase [Actinomadura viridis]MBG6092557.1 pimeloyl-ACP methyl ester carboxylesterase [Actinomadura viridis]
MDIVFERRGDGPPLVLLHGIGHRLQGWQPVMDRLAEERDVIAVDLPGFGASPPLPAGTPYTVDATIGVLTDLFERLGVERPHIAGNSLGGLFSLEAADRGLVSSATVLSPAGFFTARELAMAASILRASRLAAGLPAPLMERLARSPRRRMTMFGMIYARPDLLDYEALAGDARALRGAAGFEPTLRAGRRVRFRGSCADVPVTIAWGTKDRLLRASQAVRAQQALPGARFVWLRGCGHVPMGDDPELVARVLLEGSDHPLRGAGDKAA